MTKQPPSIDTIYSRALAVADCLRAFHSDDAEVRHADARAIDVLVQSVVNDLDNEIIAPHLASLPKCEQEHWSWLLHRLLPDIPVDQALTKDELLARLDAARDADADRTHARYHVAISSLLADAPIDLHDQNAAIGRLLADLINGGSLLLSRHSFAGNSDEYAAEYHGSLSGIRARHAQADSLLGLLESLASHGVPVASTDALMAAR